MSFGKKFFVRDDLSKKHAEELQALKQELAELRTALLQPQQQQRTAVYTTTTEAPQVETVAVMDYQVDLEEEMLYIPKGRIADSVQMPRVESTRGELDAEGVTRLRNKKIKGE